MKNITILLCKVSIFHLIIAASGFNTILAQQEAFSLKSEILGETREMNVHLPKDYDDKNKSGYAVLYMLDGGGDDALAAATARKLYKEKIMSKIIIVAIKSIRRGYDFTPPYEKLGRGANHRKGNGDKFLAFIKNELIPQTNKKYRTNNQQYFMGHSWGGAFATYVLSQTPELFNGFFIFSPTILYASTIEESTETLFADLTKNFNNNHTLPAFIYVSVGEDEQSRFKESYKALVAYLKKNAPAKIRLQFAITKDAAHMENPEISIPIAFRFGWEISKIIK